MLFRHRLEVRFRDCDPMGHVNNAVYLTYLEQARLAHWRAVWGMELDELPPGTPGVILARAEIDYRRPAEHGNRLEVRIALARVGRTSFAYDYEIMDQDDRLIARATTVQVMYDYAAGKPVEMPADLRARLGVPVST